MTDGNLLEIFGTPEIPVGAHGTQVEAGDPKRFRADLAVPGIETAKIQIRVAVRQSPGFDRMRVIAEKDEDVAIAGVQRRRILRDVDERIVGHRRPVQQTGYLPDRIACPIASNVHDGRDQIPVPDAPVFRTGDRTQLHATVVHLECLHHFGIVTEEPVLQIDRRQRCWQLTHIARRGANQAAELTVAPVCWRDRFTPARNDQG